MEETKRNFSATNITNYDKTVKLFEKVKATENHFSVMANEMDGEEKIAAVIENLRRHMRGYCITLK